MSSKDIYAFEEISIEVCNYTTQESRMNLYVYAGVRVASRSQHFPSVAN